MFKVTIKSTYKITQTFKTEIAALDYVAKNKYLLGEYKKETTPKGYMWVGDITIELEEENMTREFKVGDEVEIIGGYKDFIGEIDTVIRKSVGTSYLENNGEYDDKNLKLITLKPFTNKDIARKIREEIASVMDNEIVDVFTISDLFDRIEPLIYQLTNSVLEEEEEDV